MATATKRTSQARQTRLTETDVLVIAAAAALLKTLGLADGELTQADADMAVGAVEDWIYDMGFEYVTDSRDTIVGQVCREVGVELEEVV